MNTTTLPQLPSTIAFLPRTACTTARVAPRGWSRLLTAAAVAFPCLQDVEVDVYACGPMHLDLRESVCTTLFKYGCYPHQLAEDKVMTGLVRPGMVAFDVGANIGWYSCLFDAIMRHTGRIVAVEPMPRALRLLESTLRRRPVVTLVPGAIGAHSGRAQLLQAEMLDVSRVEYTETGTAEVVTIDGLAERFGSPDFIKLDVEGAELLALMGATAVLSGTRRPTIVFEYVAMNAAAYGGYTLHDVDHFLALYGYSVRRITHDAAVVPLDSSTARDRLTNNYLAIPA